MPPSAALLNVEVALDSARTQATRARARVKVLPQSSHIVKLERCTKLTDLSDLMLADRGGERYGATAAFRSSTRRLPLLHHGRA